MATKKPTKPFPIAVYASKVKAKILPDEKAYRGRVVAAGPARITVEIEVDDDHGFRKGVPVLLVRDSDLDLDEVAARITDESAAKMRAVLRQPSMRTSNGGAALRELLKRRAKQARKAAS